MPASKSKSGSWISRFYYTTYNGERKQAFKRGFSTKKEALEYERDFLAKAEFQVSMSFKNLCYLYLDDISHRVKATTYNLRKVVINQRILPTLEKMQVCELTPAHIRKFQNSLMLDKKYSQTYLKLINSTLSGIFNFAVKFYKLESNPVTKAGSIGKTKTDMDIWTVEEFKKVSEISEKRIDIYTILNVLFFTGMRIGELLALTYEDIDFEKQTIRINKTLVRINGRNEVTPPKTESSIREILINKKLVDIIKKYSEKLYSLNKETRLFKLHQTNIRKQIKSFAEKVGVKIIRVHDLRHSHASLLIHLGVNPLAISKRLGHENIDTTLNTYSHLYPDASKKIVEMLEEV